MSEKQKPSLSVQLISHPIQTFPHDIRNDQARVIKGLRDQSDEAQPCYYLFYKCNLCECPEPERWIDGLEVFTSSIIMTTELNNLSQRSNTYQKMIVYIIINSLPPPGSIGLKRISSATV